MASNPVAARSKKAVKNSGRTRQRILAALGRLLGAGFRDVGINAVAREAKVDKVLIYRYFGGMPQLLVAYAREGNFWPTAEELLADFHGKLPKDGAALASTLLIGFGRALRRRPVTQEIMRWSLIEQNELTEALARYREEQGLRWFAMVREPRGLDIRALGSVLGAGLTYLALRSKTAKVYNGLQLRNPRDWARLEKSVDSLVHLAFEAHSGRERPQKSSPETTRPSEAAKKRKSSRTGQRFRQGERAAR